MFIGNGPSVVSFGARVAIEVAPFKVRCFCLLAMRQVVAEDDTSKPNLSHLWIMGIDVQSTGVAPEAMREVTAMRDEVKNRNIVVQLSYALQTGMATGETGALSIASVDITDLDRALAYAKRVGCQTNEATQLMLTAVLIKKLRTALLAGDWRKLEQVPWRVLSSVCSVCVGAP